ncbi:hypothetical protein YC2023_067044 [Brassica napus]
MCSRKLLCGVTSFRCSGCSDKKAVGVVRFRVQMAVEDVTNAALFVAFDEEITKLSLGRNQS